MSTVITWGLLLASVAWTHPPAPLPPVLPDGGACVSAGPSDLPEWSVGGLVEYGHASPVLAKAARGRACEPDWIYWAPERRLRIADFWGHTGPRGLAAEASTGITSRSSGSYAEPTFRLDIRAYFEPCGSWIRDRDRDARTLAHEQVHFDITELFARRLARRYLEAIDSHATFQREHTRIYDAVWAESRAMQARYDTEVYADPYEQSRWIAQVATLLAAEAPVPEGGLQLPMRASRR